MPRVKMTPKQIKKAVVRDRAYRLKKERERFEKWYQSLSAEDRASSHSVLMWWAWRYRAGFGD